MTKTFRNQRQLSEDKIEPQVQLPKDDFSNTLPSNQQTFGKNLISGNGFTVYKAPLKSWAVFQLL